MQHIVCFFHTLLFSYMFCVLWCFILLGSTLWQRQTTEWALSRDCCVKLLQIIFTLRQQTHWLVTCSFNFTFILMTNANSICKYKPRLVANLLFAYSMYVWKWLLKNKVKTEMFTHNKCMSGHKFLQVRVTELTICLSLFFFIVFEYFAFQYTFVILSSVIMCTSYFICYGLGCCRHFS